MLKPYFLLLFLLLVYSCQPKQKYQLDEKLLSSMGSSIKIDFEKSANALYEVTMKDTMDLDAFLALADTKIFLYVFGYSSRKETVPYVKEALKHAVRIDSLHTESLRVKATLAFLDWDWEKAERNFISAIQKEPANINARHWYSLYHAAMGDLDKAMAQHDTIISYDKDENYLIGRGSIYYFMEAYSTLKELMHKTILKDTLVPWPYDWLGMAYNGLEEHDDALKTYMKAFELSDGTVEIGAGLGHAMGDAGEIELASKMADFYTEKAKDHYLPPCQRSFIHISIGEYEEALNLLQQAYEEQSWFLIFMKIEHWYNPIRMDERFQEIYKKMNYPE